LGRVSKCQKFTLGGIEAAGVHPPAIRLAISVVVIPATVNLSPVGVPDPSLRALVMRMASWMSRHPEFPTSHPIRSTTVYPPAGREMAGGTAMVRSSELVVVWLLPAATTSLGCTGQMIPDLAGEGEGELEPPGGVTAVATKT
jgi:hypothetical protein